MGASAIRSTAELMIVLKTLRTALAPFRTALPIVFVISTVLETKEPIFTIVFPGFVDLERAFIESRRGPDQAH